MLHNLPEVLYLKPTSPAVKGMTMDFHYIPSKDISTKLRNFFSSIPDYTPNGQRIFFEDLDELEQQEALSYLLEAKPPKDAYEFMHESDNFELFISSFIKLLRNRSDDQTLAFIVKETALKYFKKTLSAIFDQVKEDACDLDKSFWEENRL